MSSIERWTPSFVAKRHDLDVAMSMFGMRFTKGGSPDGLVELFVEDDESWHYKCSFNHLWLKDLIACALRAEQKWGLTRRKGTRKDVATLVASLEPYIGSDDTAIRDRKQFLRLVADRILDDIGR